MLHMAKELFLEHVMYSPVDMIEHPNQLHLCVIFSKPLPYQPVPVYAEKAEPNRFCLVQNIQACAK